MRRHTNGLTTVSCDVPGCKSEPFRTFSLASVAREQANLHAGFTRQKLGAFEGWEKWEKGSRRSKEIDCCEKCKPKPRMTGAADSLPATT